MYSPLPEELHAREQAGVNSPSLFLSTARARIVPVCGLSWLSTKSIGARVRKALLVGETDLHGIGRIARARALPGARHLGVAQVGLLIAVEIQINGIERDHRGEQRPAVAAARDQIAARDFGPADPPGDGARDAREAQVELRGLECGLRARDVGLRLGDRAGALVEFFLRHGAAFPQALHAHRLDARQIERGLVALQVRRRAIVLRLVGPRIDDEQQISRLDHAPSLKATRSM